MSGDLDTRGLPTSSQPIEGGVAIVNASVPPGHPEHVVYRGLHRDELLDRASSAGFRRANELSMLRIERDRRLSASDWVELPTNTRRLELEQLAAWLAYRQALRDFPAVADPSAPDWPVPPA